jgi:hypothetical protein
MTVTQGWLVPRNVHRHPEDALDGACQPDLAAPDL